MGWRFSERPVGHTSGTMDGGATWSDANRRRPFHQSISLYRDGADCRLCFGWYDLSVRGNRGAGIDSSSSLEMRSAAGSPIPYAWETLEIGAQLPDDAKAFDDHRSSIRGKCS